MASRRCRSESVHGGSHSGRLGTDISPQDLGFAVGAMLGKQWYLVTGFADANAVPTECGCDSFDGGELFKHI